MGLLKTVARAKLLCIPSCLSLNFSKLDARPCRIGFALFFIKCGPAHRTLPLHRTLSLCLQLSLVEWLALRTQTACWPIRKFSTLNSPSPPSSLSLSFKLNPVHYCRCKGVATRVFVPLNLQNSTFTYIPHTVYCTVYMDLRIQLLQFLHRTSIYCKCSRSAEIHQLLVRRKNNWSLELISQ